jgi:hypothetical protein
VAPVDPGVFRRRYLAALGATATGLVAGCATSTGPGEDSTADPGETTTGPTTGTTAPTDTSTTRPAPGDRLVNPSFEDGLAGWTVGRDLPDRPGESDRPVDSAVQTTTARAHDGAQSLELRIDGSADDGTVWVAQPVDFAGVDGVQVHGYSEAATFNVLARLAVYAGPTPEDGLREALFDTSEQTGDHAGWKRYDYDVEFSGTGLLAVGTSVVWETTVTRLLDDVRLVGAAD